MRKTVMLLSQQHVDGLCGQVFERLEQYAVKRHSNIMTICEPPAFFCKLYRRTQHLTIVSPTIQLKNLIKTTVGH